MDIKNILKNIKLQESTISMVMGVLVIIVIGIFGVNYFSQQTEQKPPFPSNGDITNNLSPTETKLPTIHTVAENESLWSISEKYYGTGYNWVDIRDANNLDNPDRIKVGSEITIPDVKPRKPVDTTSPTTIAKVSPTLESTSTPTSTNSPTPTKKLETITPTPTPKANEPSVSSEHVVASGETLWKISEKYYGTGYDWTKIAKENNIKNPNKIEIGQTLKIPTSNQTAAATDSDQGKTGETEKYTVQKGDSLWKIAQSQLGNPYLWVKIAKLNKLKNPSVIHAGNVLEIPKK
ncbi:MAG: LysM peptidoglycan-binding domain-containing protein [Patescibacteria group bacterium]|nr:LysM peptidoglycan-binding domain-containing protein [Patescibacteria group bacterium]